MFIHLLQAAFLGLVQGVTEFLPISSTAHLIIVEKLFGLDQNTYGLSFDMFTNLGTVLAVIIFFWKDLKDLFGKLRLPNNKPFTEAEKLPWLILIATVPVGLVGLLLEKHIETDFRSLSVIAVGLAIVGVFFIVAERYAKNHSKILKPTGIQLLLISLSQAIALAPGVSRSGVTITTALFLGIERVTAAQYSFMLSVPINILASGKKLVDFGKDAAHHGVAPDIILFYLVGTLVSFITGYITLRFLLSFYKKYSLTTFAYYRFILAIVLLILITKYSL